MFLIKNFALKINLTWVYYYGMLRTQVSVCAHIVMCAIEVYLTDLMYSVKLTSSTDIKSLTWTSSARSLFFTESTLICLSVCRVAAHLTSVHALSASSLHVVCFPGLSSANMAACMLTPSDLLSAVFGFVCLSVGQKHRESGAQCQRTNIQLTGVRMMMMVAVLDCVCGWVQCAFLVKVQQLSVQDCRQPPFISVIRLHSNSQKPVLFGTMTVILSNT